MAFKTVLAVLALASVPGFALAQGCIHEKMTQTSSQCAPGQVWNAAVQACVAPATS